MIGLFDHPYKLKFSIRRKQIKSRWQWCCPASASQPGPVNGANVSIQQFVAVLSVYRDGIRLYSNGDVLSASFLCHYGSEVFRSCRKQSYGNVCFHLWAQCTGSSPPFPPCSYFIHISIYSFHVSLWRLLFYSSDTLFLKEAINSLLKMSWYVFIFLVWYLLSLQVVVSD